MQYNGSQLSPLFCGEISSTRLFFDIFDKFLTEMAANNEWLLLRFYSGLFRLARDTNHLRFYGNGTRGFSIKLEVVDKGEISLCTLYRNKTGEFSLKR